VENSIEESSEGIFAGGRRGKNRKTGDSLGRGQSSALIPILEATYAGFGCNKEMLVNQKPLHPQTASSAGRRDALIELMGG